ncbi:MAG: agmatine deiminase family protein [Bacteroidales bacterium]|nr:agmatine deiminase family protein [Bacteroidales bacterium]
MSDKDIKSEFVRVPSEWEPYETVMVAWPHADTDWKPMLSEIDECYCRIAEAIAESGLRLLILTPEPERLKTFLGAIPADRVILFKYRTNDTWTRDYGPITVYSHDGIPFVCDFRFDGWGLKFASNLDNLANLTMLGSGLLTRNYISRMDYTFEGGSMEVDGNGTMLSTAHCLQSLNRNGYKTIEQLGDYFRHTLGIKRLFLLEHGHLEGDDTDSHIDTLARFAPGDTIVYVKCYNPNDSHYEELNLMEKELQELRTEEGLPYNLIGLPLPDAIYDEDGERLPATYANFLVTPASVLMPVYGQPDNDRLALQMLQVAYPDREIRCVDCRALIRQHGSLHCATMQLPEGVVRI